MTTRLVHLAACVVALVVARPAAAQPPAPTMVIVSAGLTYDTGRLPCPSADRFRSDVVDSVGYDPFARETRRRALASVGGVMGAVPFAPPLAAVALGLVVHTAADAVAAATFGVPLGRFVVTIRPKGLIVAKVTFEPPEGEAELLEDVSAPTCAAVVAQAVGVLHTKLSDLRRDLAQRAAAVPPPDPAPTPPPTPAPAEPLSRAEMPPEDPVQPAKPPSPPPQLRVGFAVLADRAALTSFGPGLLASLGFRKGSFVASAHVRWDVSRSANLSAGHELNVERWTLGLALCWLHEMRHLRLVACGVGEGGPLLRHAQGVDGGNSFVRGGLGQRLSVEVPFPLPGLLPEGLFVHVGEELLWGFGQSEGESNSHVSPEHPRGNLGLGGGLLFEWPARSHAGQGVGGVGPGEGRQQ